MADPVVNSLLESGCRALVMGLGRFGGGVGVTRFLAQRGCQVRVTDQAGASQLGQSLSRLADLPITYRLGEHCESDFVWADLVVVNPAVDARQNRYLQAAIQSGAVLTSEISLLIQHLPAGVRTVGITGSAGKSTTTAMLGCILQARLSRQHVHIGGNLGGSLLSRLPDMRAGHCVVLELSSFMLESLTPLGWSPHVAVVTNLSPNHLDRHGTLEAYRDAKQVILNHQQADDVAILTAQSRPHFKPAAGTVIIADQSLAPADRLLLPGSHNQLNAALAIEAARAVAGVAVSDAVQAVAGFSGLPHRLQLVLEYAGVRFYNDSKATTPQAAELAIESFPPGSVHVILGGYDKGSDFHDLARLAGRHCQAVYTIGQTGSLLAELIESLGDQDMAAAVHGPSVDYDSCSSAGWATSCAPVHRCGDLEAAVEQAVRNVQQGDVVLLSPGCASYDQFRNYEQRGTAFVQAALRCTGEGAPIPLRKP